MVDTPGPNLGPAAQLALSLRAGWSLLWPYRPLLIGGAVLFATLVFFAGLPPLAGVIGYGGVVALAAIRSVPRQSGADLVRRPRLAPKAAIGDMAATVRAIPSAAFLLDQSGEIIVQNDAAREMTAPVAAGRHISAVVRAPEVLEALDEARAFSQSRTVTYSERVPVHRWLEASVSPIAAKGLRSSAPSHMLLLVEDLTQKQSLEQMRADFVANASHELRTPLASLFGFIETLQGPAKNDPAARERFLEIMREQAARMSRLISDLMSLSRIEANAHVRPETPVDLNAVVGHVVDALGLVARDEGCEIRVSAEANRPCVIFGDADELTQVFQNLIENAIKYGGAGGFVDVRVAYVERPGKPSDWIDVAVEDYGDGIPPDEVPRLTERFYRVDVESSREKGGTGLGLAIVKHILNRHRAALNIDSTVGSGSIFTVRFDAVRSEKADASKP